MIDIHNHLLPNVDDGSISIDTSISLLEEAKNIGIKKIICTPHYRVHMFETPIDVIKEKFLQVSEVAKEMGIELYLGHEVKCRNSDEITTFINNNCLIPMNNKMILLLEFSYDHDPDINEIIYNAKLKGYKVILAHIERYKYLSFDDIVALKKCGAYIQVNAESVIGKDGSRGKKIIKKLIKHGIVDFVASDSHYNRENFLLSAYNYVKKKYGDEISQKLFYQNAEEILIK